MLGEVFSRTKLRRREEARRGASSVMLNEVVTIGPSIFVTGRNWFEKYAGQN